MKKIEVLLLLLLAGAGLAANPAFYPLTTIAESCVIDGQAASEAALQSMDTVLGATNRGEFIAARLYHASGELSNPSGEARLAELGATTVPTVVFNGGIDFVGPTPGIAYSNMAQSLRYMPSPVRLSTGDFDHYSGEVSAILDRIDPQMAAGAYRLIWYLLEDNVGTATNVVRQVLYQDISLPAVGQPATFNTMFSISPAWVRENLWAATALEKDGQNILQSDSTLPLPTNSIRCAFDWWSEAHNMIAPPNNLFNSGTFWIFNTGGPAALQMQIVVDSAPEDWYFNYCDDSGACYPGSMLIPLNLAAGESKSFHLTLIVGSTGIAHFRYQIVSPELGTFSVPFTVRTTDYVDASDELLVAAPFRLQAASPNPFREGTVFTVSADKALSAACIQIYDSRGRKVAETAPRNLQQGTNQIAWQAPQGLASGVYFYRLKNAPASLRRMLHLK